MIYATGLVLDELDPRTRTLMVSELNTDLANGRVFVSPWLTREGRRQWSELLRIAMHAHDATWLADTLEYNEFLRILGGDTQDLDKRVPPTAARTLAEGQFHGYYIRAVCRRALDEGFQSVAIFRAGPAAHGSRSGEDLVDSVVCATELLADLRTAVSVAPAARFLDGPNSGLSVRIPRSPTPQQGS